MIEFLGLLYDVAKDIKDYLAWEEDVKVVDRKWLEKSGFGQAMRDKGYDLRWSKPERIESRKLDGYEFIYEIDKLKRKKRRIEWRSANDSLVLIGKKLNI